ncbi:MAG TPA: alpha/beta fold hydrolase [Caulobacteraceae bacterium]|jgi:putative redox protein|nr:alpha/beta fold hydrolase [Caulobacteraceae bacterium]
MRTEKIEFTNAAGHKLAGRLDRPDGTAHAYALFAHCFTCDKGSKAAVHISRALAALGVATLRFDFTGLGESEGELTGFSGNVQDLIAAARRLQQLGCAPSLLIGHSLGGAAALATAGELPSVKAVATIAAPADVAHVLTQLGEAAVAKIEAEGQAQVQLGGRPFTLDRAFIEDARLHDLKHRIEHLGRALLILHSPVDATVGVENASEIFLAAHHPKSFVSLDKADHLLSHAEDADYAAAVIAAWAGKYIAMAPDRPAEVADGPVLVEETGAGKFQVQVSVHGTRFFADEPVDVGGMGSGPSPYELLAAGLGACTAMTLRLYAGRKAWPLQRVRVAVRHDKDAAQAPPDVFDRQLTLEGPLDAEQIARLFEIADKCPVHQTLERGARVTTGHGPAAPIKAEAEEHFCDMEEACRDADAAA